MIRVAALCVVAALVVDDLVARDWPTEREPAQHMGLVASPKEPKMTIASIPTCGRDPATIIIDCDMVAHIALRCQDNQLAKKEL